MQLIATLKAFRSDNVTSFAIFVFEKRNVSGTIRVVFNTFNDRTDAIFIPLEINKAILLFMAAADMPSGNSTIVIPTTSFGLLLQ